MSEIGYSHTTSSVSQTSANDCKYADLLNSLDACVAYTNRVTKTAPASGYHRSNCYVYTYLFCRCLFSMLHVGYVYGRFGLLFQKVQRT